MPSLLQTIKQAAVEAVDASDPSTFLFGTVMSTSPLQIQIDQKTILTESFLFLTGSVKDYDAVMEVEHETEKTAEHTHMLKGKKVFHVKNGLSEGEKVILIKQKGGQRYIVLDRIMEEEG